MAEVRRVPAPRSPLDGRWRPAAAALGVVLATLVLKPWEGSPGPAPLPHATPWPSAPPLEHTDPSAWRAWDQATLGATPPEPAWELWAAGRTTRIRFVGPADGFNPRPSIGP